MKTFQCLFLRCLGEKIKIWCNEIVDLRVRLQADKRPSWQAIRRPFLETAILSSHLKAKQNCEHSPIHWHWEKWVIPFTQWLMAFHSAVHQVGKDACNSLRVPLLWAEISLKHGSGFAVVICSPLQLLFSACAVEVPGGLGQIWFGLQAYPGVSSSLRIRTVVLILQAQDLSLKLLAYMNYLKDYSWASWLLSTLAALVWAKSSAFCKGIHV